MTEGRVGSEEIAKRKNRDIFRSSSPCLQGSVGRLDNSLACDTMSVPMSVRLIVDDILNHDGENKRMDWKSENPSGPEMHRGINLSKPAFESPAAF